MDFQAVQALLVLHMRWITKLNFELYINQRVTFKIICCLADPASWILEIVRIIEISLS